MSDSESEDTLAASDASESEAFSESLSSLEGISEWRNVKRTVLMSSARGRR